MASDPNAPRCPVCGKPMYGNDPKWCDMPMWECLNAECGETETQQELAL